MNFLPLSSHIEAPPRQVPTLLAHPSIIEVAGIYQTKIVVKTKENHLDRELIISTRKNQHNYEFCKLLKKNPRLKICEKLRQSKKILIKYVL